MSEEATITEQPAAETAPEVAPAAAPAAPVEPAQATFTQEQVNALLAKERSTATRKAKQSVKAAAAPQEPLAGATQAPVADERLDKLTSVVEGLVQTIETSKAEGEYTSAVVGLSFDETEAAIAPTLFKHDRPQFDAMIARVKARDLPPEKKGPGHIGLGAPRASEATGRPANPNEWSSDDVASMRADGTFLPSLKAFRNSLSGGSGKLFPAKNLSGGSKK